MFPDLIINPQIHASPQTPITRNIIQTSDKEKILKAPRKNTNNVEQQRFKKKMIADFWSGSFQTTSQESNPFRLKEKPAVHLEFRVREPMSQIQGQDKKKRGSSLG